MSSNWIEAKIIQQACKRDNHTIVTWDYEGHMWYISKTKKKANMMWIFFDY